MKCPACSGQNTRVTCTTNLGKIVKRYCRCLDCKLRFRTIERYEGSKPGSKKGVPRPGNIAKGVSHGSAILTEENILEIRRLHQQGATLKMISEKYGMSASYMSRIANKKVWTHL